jgi:hypothetical protein
MIFRQISKITFICLAVFVFGCAGKKVENEPPKETGVVQNSSPEAKEKIAEPTNTQTPKSYIACGCGCCGGVKPIKRCLYRSNGDDLQKIIDEDREQGRNPQCDRIGCAIGIEYK